MATFTKINSFVENLAEGVINLAGTLVVALTNTAHTATWDELADLTQVSYTNLSSRNLTLVSSEQLNGDYRLKLADLTLTASGAVGPFQYIYIYDENSTGDKLICYADYGSAVTMASGDTFAIDLDGSTGVIVLS